MNHATQLLEVTELHRCRVCGAESARDTSGRHCCAEARKYAARARRESARMEARRALKALERAHVSSAETLTAQQALLNILASLGCRVCGKHFEPRDIREVTVCRNHSLCFAGGCLTKAVERGWFPDAKSAWRS